VALFAELKLTVDVDDTDRQTHRLHGHRRC